MAPPRTLSKQGLEIQFAVNHLAHMLLTKMLLPLLAVAQSAIVVTVTSGAQFMGRINWNDLDGKKYYDRWAFYSQSKLANVMFALELDMRLRKENSPVSSLVAHPGLARTNLQQNSFALNQNKSWQELLLSRMINSFSQTASMGALPQLFAATDSEAKGGQHYCPRFNFRGCPKLGMVASLALNLEERKKLWKLSESLINYNFNYPIIN